MENNQTSKLDAKLLQCLTDGELSFLVFVVWSFYAYGNDLTSNPYFGLTGDGDKYDTLRYIGAISGSCRCFSVHPIALRIGREVNMAEAGKNHTTIQEQLDLAVAELTASNG